MDALNQLLDWISEERRNQNPFAHGAVLGTVASDGTPKTRMLGVYFDSSGCPRFHTAAGSRKVVDISRNSSASLTFSFQYQLRSVSIEGILEPLSQEQLLADWRSFTPTFRRSYMIFGAQSGQRIDSNEVLETQLAHLPADAELATPPSFIGYRFAHIQRIAYYSVGKDAFAQHVVFNFDALNKQWLKSVCVP